MLDLKKIIENPELIKARLAKKGHDVDFSSLLALDAERKQIILEVEQMKAERNKVSADIPRLKKAGEDVAPIFANMKKLGETIALKDARLNEVN